MNGRVPPRRLYFNAGSDLEMPCASQEVHGFYSKVLMWSLAFDKGRSKVPRNFRSSSHFVKRLHYCLLRMSHFNTPISYDFCLAPQSQIAATPVLQQNNEEAEGCNLNYHHYHAMGPHVKFLYIGLPIRLIVHLGYQLSN
jgi:hypothetical protein